MAVSNATIQVVLEPALLRAADRAARRLDLNRSALIRDALRDHLLRLEAREREQRDRAGYGLHPDTGVELAAWEDVASWPQE